MIIKGHVSTLVAYLPPFRSYRSSSKLSASPSGPAFFILCWLWKARKLSTMPAWEKKRTTLNFIDAQPQCTQNQAESHDMLPWLLLFPLANDHFGYLKSSVSPTWSETAVARGARHLDGWICWLFVGEKSPQKSVTIRSSTFCLQLTLLGTPLELKGWH